MEVFCTYVSGACNSSPRCLDWWKGLVCYGCCHNVLIYDPEFNSGDGIVRECLNGHTGNVNTVKWIRNSNIDELISGSVDKSIILWGKNDSEKYFAKQIIRSHESSVTVVDSLTDGAFSLLASTSSDFTIRVHRRKNVLEDYILCQTIQIGKGFGLDVKMNLLPSSLDPVLAIAGDDSLVHLYALEDGGCFEKKLSLFGHEDWVRGIDFTVSENGDLLLVSCSQDSFIRLWRISNKKLSENSLDRVELKKNIFKSSNQEFVVILDSVMSGHDNWVYGVHWENGKNGKRIVSSSMDKTVIIWEQDEENGLWLEKIRLGEVGGNNLGFYEAIFSPDGNTVLAHGYHGSFHKWSKVENTLWEPDVCVRGHFEAVNDLIWGLNGEYLLSGSLDKTTRLHGLWKREGIENSWHELARPQIHGYEIQALALIGRTQFASGADEKVIRIFNATQNFVDNFGTLNGAKEWMKNLQLPEGASVPSLGLSNKAVFQSDLNNASIPEEPKFNTEYPEFYFESLKLKSPPTEEILLQNTLWPETQKLYGHGYEIFSLACNHRGTILASACKSSKPDGAAIILWSTDNWKEIGKLTFHTLTVTQMRFSPDDNYLLSVSRDRTWCIYRKQKDDIYQKIVNSEKKTCHSRIIWSCAWSHDSIYFATVSRDKKVMIWKLDEKEDQVTVNQVSVLDLEDSVTAVDFAPVLVEGCYLITLGLENGVILLYNWCPIRLTAWELIIRLNQSQAHHLTVKKIAFSPVSLQFASCGSDHLVRIYQIKTNQREIK